MKLVVQIPAWNEEEILPRAVSALPRRVPGFSEVRVLVVDDGSSDRTAEVARMAGADRVVSLSSHRGLATAFRVALAEALAMGADVIVNFDADLQYDPADIPALVAPLLADRADLVVGDRRPGTLPHFSPVKRMLQRFGSHMVRRLSGLEVGDAASGFRAFTREAARRMNVFSKMTYTLETLIQAGFKDLRVASVPVRAHPVARRSRLFGSPARYVLIQGANVLRITALYKPLKMFSMAAAIIGMTGLAIAVPVLLARFAGRSGNHALALAVSAVLVVTAVLMFLAGVLADLSAINREFLEDLRLRDSRIRARADSERRIAYDEQRERKEIEN